MWHLIDIVVIWVLQPMTCCFPSVLKLQYSDSEEVTIFHFCLEIFFQLSCTSANQTNHIINRAARLSALQSFCLVNTINHCLFAFFQYFKFEYLDFIITCMHSSFLFIILTLQFNSKLLRTQKSAVLHDTFFH